MYPDTAHTKLSSACRQALAATLLLAVLAGCGGGGGSSPTAMPIDSDGSSPPPAVEPMPVTPAVASTLTATNAEAIDPTLAFRAVELPTEPGFTVTKTAPASPVVVFNRHDGPAADLAPDDLDAMMRRAAHLWTRRLTDGGTYPVELYVGFPQAEQCGVRGAACSAGQGDAVDITPNALVRLPDDFLELSSTESGETPVAAFKIFAHELGHALSYRDPVTNLFHAACTTEQNQLMCERPGPITPAEADFAGLVNWTVTPAVSASSYQHFGLWATLPGTPRLEGFGITVRRTLSADEDMAAFQFRLAAATDALSDTIAITAEVRGAPGSGPAASLGTATWSGIFLGAGSARFEPVTGNATLSADLAQLDTIGLALTGLERTNSAGTAHPLASAAYELERHGNAWIDRQGRADARFYATGEDPAGAAAGVVNDETRSLIGAWGGTRD